MSRSNHISACALLLSLCCCASWAQEVEISSSPTPIGAGARAAGMADAFVAVADDATAASWNPAGLVQLERPEISMVGEYASLSERFSANDHDEFRVSNSSDNLDLNYLSIAYPLPFLVLGRNVCVSLNYQRKYDFTRAFRLEYDQTQRVGSSIASTFLKMGFKQSGALGCITPAFAFEVTKHLSLGASLNIWRSSFLCDNSWEQTTRSEMESFFRGHPEYSFVDTFEQYSGFEGLNVTTGLLWNMTDKWNLGLRYDSAFTGNAKYGSIQTQRRLMNPLPILTPFMVQEKRQVRFPASFAAGLAYRANDRLTLSADVTRTDWNDFFVRDAQGTRHSLVDFSNMDDPDERTRFDPTLTIRFGTEYAFIPKHPDEELNMLWTVRGGVFYSEEPATNKPNSDVNAKGDGKPDSFYGVALGCGLLTHQRVNIDLAYQLRTGVNVNRDLVRGVPGFSEDTLQHRIILSTVIYF